MSVDYDSYLGLPQILSSQFPESSKTKNPAHDEMLFIIVHQTYELWFKQILHELESVTQLFSAPIVDESHMGIVAERLHRVVEIEKHLVRQIDILETMTPLDFLEFRDLLYPASGFQSYQFRRLEVLLGLKNKTRLFYASGSFKDALQKDQQKEISTLEDQPSLFDCVEKWLERTPFVKTAHFDFWDQYQLSVNASFEMEKLMVSQSPLLNSQEKARNLETIANNKALFDSFLDEKVYSQRRDNGEIRLSHTAARAALFIQLYRDEPALQLPFRLMTLLMEIDEQLTTWRYRHALMAKRMLGTKMGTGGSSGAKYLQASAETHKIFSDFFVLTTFLLPRSKRPVLPEPLRRALGFQFHSGGL